MILYLFTNTYPFCEGGEAGFIEPELGFLKEKFSKVFIIPKRKLVENEHCLPSNVYVDESLIRVVEKSLKFYRLPKLFFKIFARKSLYKEMAKKPLMFFSLGKLLSLLVVSGKIEIFDLWCKTTIGPEHSRKNATMYSFWKNHIPFALGRYKNQFDLKIISRCHGYDIYEERFFGGYIPYYQQELDVLDYCAPGQEDGTTYIKSKFNIDDNNIGTHYLGTKMAENLSTPSADGVFRIVSCSSLIPLKRVDLIIKSIIRLAKNNPSKIIEWSHFGDGNERKSCAALLMQAGDNLIWTLKGNVKNEVLRSYYGNKPVDVFINLSEFEGLPVSVIEALSYGIPCVATDVGGTVEAVNNDNGLIVSKNISAQEVASKLQFAMDDVEDWNKKRLAAVKTWSSNFSVEKNRSKFIDEVLLS